jgi:glycosyltransferase involved in cell wall biosynthesis
MRLLSVITSLNPAHGGPVECVLQLQRNFTKLGHSLDIATMDNSAAPWNRTLPFEPICLGNPGRDTTSIQPTFINFLRQYQAKYDGSIFHGIWGFQCVALRLAWNGSHPYAVFCHGTLDPYFIRHFPFKHIKKSLFYRLIAAPVLGRAHAVLFTCEEERRLANTSYRPVVGKRVVVRYGIDAPQFDINSYHGPLQQLAVKLKGKDALLYLGRIHPKKGCDLLLHALSRVASTAPRIHLLMAGPDAISWTPALKKLANKLRIADRVHWIGPAYGDEKWYLYRRADAFILPSHMENFGMSVAEALSQRVPVLISNKVNIFDSVMRSSSGFVEPDTIDGTASLLQRWANCSPEQRNRMRENAYNLFHQQFEAIGTAEDVARVFQSGSDQIRSERRSSQHTDVSIPTSDSFGLKRR